VVTYVRCRCQENTRLCDSGSECVTISHMILNLAIQRYILTDYFVQSHLKLKDRRRRPEGGVNKSQSKFLKENWPISQNQPDVLLF
jgi:hypothetical protein